VKGKEKKKVVNKQLNEKDKGRNGREKLGQKKNIHHSEYNAGS
jgi:hypothetical protein